MPLWAVILSVTFSGIAALGVPGIILHARKSAKDSGRLEQAVLNLTEELGRQRDAVGKCQQIETCGENMRTMNARIDSTHKRMDRQDQRLDQHDVKLTELAAQVGELRGAHQA